VKKRRSNNFGATGYSPGAMLEVIYPLPFYESDSSPMRELCVGETVMILESDDDCNDCKLITAAGVVGYVHSATIKHCTRTAPSHPGGS